MYQEELSEYPECQKSVLVLVSQGQQDQDGVEEHQKIVFQSHLFTPFCILNENFFHTFYNNFIFFFRKIKDLISFQEK